jgi:ppGpp synthetase/RelA/SpoT-type nucleotidyltranferase
MAKLWTSPQFPKGRVDWAGDVLAAYKTVSASDFESALGIINNWRSSHSYPLQAIKMTLRKRARQVDNRAIIAQRLKRLSSISAKLVRNRQMHLSQMQDIGGCRAVLKDMARVNSLVKLYTESWAKNPKVRAEFVKAFDYINGPKIDGYRGIHLIYKYRSASRRHRVWKGLRIEIQIRSRLQHAWATAVETVDAFTGQGLKVSGGTGTEKKDWGRFFALMSSAIACREKCPMVPNTPSTEEELIRELKALTQQLNVVSTLGGWTFAMKSLGVKTAPDAVLFLLILDTAKYEYTWQAFKRSQIKEAQKAYLNVEKKLESTPGSQAVLVSADSMEAVRAAYPNFYADTSAFVRALNEAIAGENERGIPDVPKSDERTTEGPAKRDQA